MRKEMQKSKMIFICVIGFLLMGCGFGRTDTPQNLEETADQESVQDVMAVQSRGRETPRLDSEEDTYVTKEFGRYIVPAGWIESEKYSSEQKFFYVLAGTEQEERPDNISVECGKNKYAAKDHERFRLAIEKQLLMQVQGMKAILTGNGFETEQGDLVYQFTIEIEDADMVTNQFYIVQDYQYILIHETAAKDPVETDKAARKMVDSFVGAEN